MCEQSSFREGTSQKGKGEYDWVVMSSLSVASQSSCVSLCSREQVRLWINWLTFYREHHKQVIYEPKGISFSKCIAVSCLVFLNMFLNVLAYFILIG
jgi:uncharacterized protein YggT (Ycf19 family)